jgi:hypothetical protein
MNLPFMVVTVVATTFCAVSATAEPKHAAPENGTSAAVDSEDPLTKGGQRNFAVGAQVGWYQASGMTLQLGTPDIALSMSGGFQPIIFNERPNSLGLMTSAEADVDGLIRIADVSGTTPLGLRLGYRYNTVVGHGLGIGGYAERRMTKVIAISGSYGITIFPRAFDRLEHRGRDPFGIAGVIGGGLSIGLLFYP